MRRFLGLPREHWIEKLSDLCSSPMSGWGPVLMCIHRWKRPRMRRRRLRTSTTDQKRPPRDLRAANRQDSIDAATWGQGGTVNIATKFFSPPSKCPIDLFGPVANRRIPKRLASALRFLLVSLHALAWGACGKIVIRRPHSPAVAVRRRRCHSRWARRAEPHSSAAAATARTRVPAATQQR